MRRAWRSGGLVAAIVLIGVAGLAGCASPAGVDGNLTNGWPAMPKAKVAVPVAAVCYDSVLDGDTWYGDFNTVPCTGDHGEETVFVGTFTGSAGNRSTPPASDSQDRRDAYAQCLKGAANYLGGDYHLGLFELGLVLPSSNAWTGGARWYRCDIVRYSDANETDVARTGSVKDGLRGKRPLAFTCSTVTDDGKGSITDQQVTDCAKPHNAEVAGLYTPPNVPWPADQKTRQNTYDSGCEAVVAKFLGLSGRVVASNYMGWMTSGPSEDQWKLGDRTVVCSALGFKGESPNGARFVGSVKGLKDKAPKWS
ncbi:septum formation family protein [Rugosimonospora africana]|uniref:Septum formation-related domain-containing protein n=1 Tax=Rugosimonospora africana TaxID=556532 RepID=A0A8J3QYE1_9ACTN|nr:septum formation family protein [Rugosimonospora africana]GIH18143.1 hypothetical protein Raf01_63150 [Rugosimonospora africana]